MKWGQGIPHQGKQALTALVLTVAFVAPACAQRRFALTPGTAQTPSAAKRQTSGDDAMSGLDKALQNAGIDSEPGRNIKTIVNFVPDDVRTERITQLTSSFNKLASAPDGQGAQAALLEVGGAVAGAALLADWHIHNDYAPKYANDRVRNIARFVEAITPILKRTGVGYTDASIKNAEEKGGGMLWRGTEGFLAASIGKSRPSALAALAADGPAFATEPDRQIIGVVADSRDNGLNQDPGPKMFVPQSQIPDAVNALNVRISPMAWVIRTKVPPLSLSGAVQEQLRQATGLPVSDIRSMAQIVSRSTSRERFNTLLMTVFALSALALAAIGIYGVMAYAVQQRTREIGVRLALGADPGAVRRMVVMQGMRLAISGVVIGVGAAYGLSRYMSTLLFGVAARDPVVFVGVPVLLAVIALVAVWVPAARASQIDPLNALRSS
jgi:hypothetical protein